MGPGFRIYDLGFGIFFWLAMSLLAGAEEPMRVWLEPKFLRAPVVGPIAGAKRTVIAAGTRRDGEFAGLTAQEYAALALSWDQFFARARGNADADLAELKPRYERDAKKVIVYAALESKQPIVAGAVLAPKFLEMFKETLGDTVLVVVPNRFTAYVFPKLASHYAEYAPLVFRAYRETAWPVSVEVFEVGADGWKCIGAYSEP